MKQNILILSLASCISFGSAVFGEILEDITVSVPTSPSLRINGTPGTGQPGYIGIASCKIDSDGNLEKFGCEKEKYYDLNQIVLLKPGYYKVTYDISLNFVEIAQDPVVIELQKINISKTDGTYTCSVFMDLSDWDTKVRFLKHQWGDSTWTKYKHQCELQEMSSERQKVCDAIYKNSRTYLEFSESVFKIISPKEYMAFALNSSGDEWLTLSSTRDIKDGDFVSALPGVYGIEFQSPKGDSTIQAGLVLK